MTFPGVAVGLYTPEEVMQFDDDKKTPTYVPMSDLRKLRDDHDNLVDPKDWKESGAITANIVGGELVVPPAGNDVPHITKSDAIVADLSDRFNGKERGNQEELIDKIAETTTIQGAKSCVTKHYNKYAYNKSERESIDNALELHIRHLEVAAV